DRKNDRCSGTGNKAGLLSCPIQVCAATIRQAVMFVVPYRERVFRHFPRTPGDAFRRSLNRKTTG
ncbi:MAG: hypothetical protein ACLFPA_03545, partial [Dichotomicrobium sp.]